MVTEPEPGHEYAQTWTTCSDCGRVLNAEDGPTCSDCLHLRRSAAAKEAAQTRAQNRARGSEREA